MSNTVVIETEDATVVINGVEDGDQVVVKTDE